MSERSILANLRARTNRDAWDRQQQECRIAGDLQREQGLPRTSALLLAYRVVNGFPSPAEDFPHMQPHLEALA